MKTTLIENSSGGKIATATFTTDFLNLYGLGNQVEGKLKKLITKTDLEEKQTNVNVLVNEDLEYEYLTSFKTITNDMLFDLFLVKYKDGGIDYGRLFISPSLSLLGNEPLVCKKPIEVRMNDIETIKLKVADPSTLIAKVENFLVSLNGLAKTPSTIESSLNAVDGAVLNYLKDTPIELVKITLNISGDDSCLARPEVIVPSSTTHYTSNEVLEKEITEIFVAVNNF